MIKENRLLIDGRSLPDVVLGGAAVRQPLYAIPRLTKPDPLTSWQRAREVTLVAAAAVATVLVTRWWAGLSFFPIRDVTAALAVLAGALALATAAMWHVLRWVTADGRASLGAGAMALYALVAIPTSSIDSMLAARGAIDAGRTAVHLVVVALLLASSMESMARSRPGSRTLLTAGLLVVLGSILFGFLDPAGAFRLAEVPTLRWLVVAGWVLAGVRVTRFSVRNGLQPSLRVGLGLTLLAVAHCYRVATELGEPGGPQSLSFAALRLVALLFIGLGALQFCRRALHDVREEVRPKASTALDARLAFDAFQIAPVVADTVGRHQAEGLDIRCDIAPGLMTRGSSDLLSEVLEQLIVDSARHAPGSSINILAWDAGWRVLLRVSDEGPDLQDASGSQERERNLVAYRRLLAGIGGDIRLHRAGPEQSGCMVQIELPVAVTTDPSAEVDADEARFSAFASEQSLRASRMFDEATQAARRVAAFASQPPGAGRLEGLQRLGLVLVLLVATLAVSRIPIVTHWLVIREVGVSLALVAVAGGVLSAFACGVLGQLGDDPAGLWLSAGLVFYSVIGIPVATYSATSPDGDAAVSNLRIVANATFVALTLAAVFAASRPRRDGWFVLFGGLLLGLAAAALGVTHPAASIALSTSPAIRFALSALWLVSGVVLVAAGGARRTPWLSWAGLGCTMIAIAHTHRAAAGSPFIPLGSTFTTVRLLGIIVLVAGVLPAARRVLVESYTARHRHLAELREAHTGLQRFAERDHDLRGGLAVLANANVLLENTVRPREEQEMLRAAVNAELARLHELLRPPIADGDGDAGYDYEIADVIQERMTLQTGPDMDVRVDVQPHLWVHGNPLVLAQVLANVLTNWQRHAPGSPLRVQAMRHEETVVLRVCDFGPGIPADIEDRVFDLEVRGPASPGQGFGLHICRRLLESEAGRIHIKRRDNGIGCTVVIELPAATGEDPSLLTDRSAS